MKQRDQEYQKEYKKEYRNRPGAKERHNEVSTELRQKAIAEKTYYCALCDYPFGTAQHLSKHLSSLAHKHVEEYGRPPYLCNICQFSSNKLSNFKDHLKTKRHNDKMKQIAAAIGC